MRVLVGVLAVVLAVVLAGCGQAGPDQSKLASAWQYELSKKLTNTQSIHGAQCIKDTDIHHFACSATLTENGRADQLVVVEMVVADDGSWITK